MEIAHIGDDNFDTEVIRASLPVLVDFWATWCGPCKAIAPVLEEIAQEYNGKLKVVKVNVDENPNVPSRYNVRSIPNLMIFKGGNLTGQIIGAVPKSKLINEIDKAIG